MTLAATALGQRSLDGAFVTAAVALAAATFRFRAARWAIGVTALLLTVSTAALAVAFIRSDFSLAYVADNSRRSSSTPYRVAGLWAGMEGSLLFWNALLAGVCAAVQRGTAAAAAVLTALVGISRLVVNPFNQLDIPAIKGIGLTPILEHPAMLYHPPVLYVGLVCTAIPFLVTVAPAARNRLDATWRREVRVGLLLTVSVLTAGLLAGANWSYAELGWGGFWAWDPIENGALIPWLASLGALHLLRAGARFNGSAAAAALAPFPLTLFGVALTRSGVTVSVHSFAQERTAGWCLFAVAIGVSVTGVVLGQRAHLFARPAPTTASRRVPPSLWAIGPLGAALAAVAIGTAAPAVARLGGGTGAPTSGSYFARTTTPLAVAALIGILYFASDRSRALARRVGAIAGATCGAALAIRGSAGLAPSALAASAVAALVSSIVVLMTSSNLRQRAAHVAHLGVALLAVGVAGAATADHVTAAIGPQTEVAVGGYRFAHRGIEVVPGPHADSSAVRLRLDVLRADRLVATLEPELVAYPNFGVLLAESDLDSSWNRDVQVVLRTADDKGNAVVDVSVRRFIRLVWLGAALIVIATAALIPRRLVGATSRAEAP